MTDREKQILRTFAVIIPKLSESSKSYLLSESLGTDRGWRFQRAAIYGQGSACII